MERVTLSCQFPPRMNEGNSETSFTGSKIFSAFLQPLETVFMILTILVTLLLPPLFPSHFLLFKNCLIFGMQKGFCGMQPGHLPLGSQDPRWDLPISWILHVLCRSCQEGMSMSGSLHSLLIHSEPPSTRVQIFFFRKFLLSHVFPTWASADDLLNVTIRSHMCTS